MITENAKKDAENVIPKSEAFKWVISNLRSLDYNTRLILPYESLIAAHSEVQKSKHSVSASIPMISI